MSGLAELSQRHARLQEISGIMSAMKALSLVETNKLARFLGHQQRMRANIENAAADFIAFHPEVGAQVASGSTTVVLLIGSERGFCGNFNDRIVQTLATPAPEFAKASFVVVGQRLSGRCQGFFRRQVRLHIKRCQTRRTVRKHVQDTLTQGAGQWCVSDDKDAVHLLKWKEGATSGDLRQRVFQYVRCLDYDFL